MTEQQARASNLDVDIYKSVFKPLKLTLTSRDERTMMKLVVERTTDRVLGCHMVGADAGEVDASCYSGNLPAALADALASDRPLLLPSGTYTLNQTLVIDYATRARLPFVCSHHSSNLRQRRGRCR